MGELYRLDGTVVNAVQRRQSPLSPPERAREEGTERMPPVTSPLSLIWHLSRGGTDPGLVMVQCRTALEHVERHTVNSMAHVCRDLRRTNIRLI
jgi:hypothetical protein